MTFILYYIESEESVNKELFVEAMFHFVLLYIVFVALVEVFGENDVTIVPDRLHSRLAIVTSEWRSSNRIN